MEKKIGTVDAPEKPKNIPVDSQWLLGQGSGAWFSITKIENGNKFNIKRFAPAGSIDCDRVFKIENNGSVFDIKKPYEFRHLSHCAKCRISQNDIIFIFNYKGE
tara:strand:- start:2302 stop:2613 length:312 start_codon:yes stop_codon:yes gene_type:complete